jgi:hypothetical protein
MMRRFDDSPVPHPLNSPNPALVTQRAAQRLPRLALFMFCAGYVIPGLFGRDPWRNADIAAFGYMVNLAEGRSAWFFPTVAGLPSDTALLPYWIGAIFVKLLGPWVGAPLAARIPFALLLVATLMLVWYSAYHLARTEAAQPLAFAFGGEADPVDYARAIADGALLAVIASLGLLLLGHETTPELAQLASVSLYLYALSATPFRGWAPRAAVLLALPALAASASPAWWASACAATRRTSRRAASCPGSPQAPPLARSLPGRSAPGAGGCAATTPHATFSAWAGCCCGSSGPPGCSACGRCGAGAATCCSTTSPCRSAAWQSAWSPARPWAAPTAR